MPTWLKSLPSGLMRWFDAKDPERDAKILAFVAAVTASIYWLTKEQIRGPITHEWVDALKWLLAAVALGGPAWAAVDKWRSNAPTIPPQPGTQDPNGGQQ